MNTTSRITSTRNGPRRSSWLGAMALSVLLGTASHAVLAAELVVVEADEVHLRIFPSLEVATYKASSPYHCVSNRRPRPA